MLISSIRTSFTRRIPKVTSILVAILLTVQFHSTSSRSITEGELSAAKKLENGAELFENFKTNLNGGLISSRNFMEDLSEDLAEKNGDEENVGYLSNLLQNVTSFVEQMKLTLEDSLDLNLLQLENGVQENHLDSVGQPSNINYNNGASLLSDRAVDKDTFLGWMLYRNKRSTPADQAKQLSEADLDILNLYGSLIEKIFGSKKPLTLSEMETKSNDELPESSDKLLGIFKRLGDRVWDLFGSNRSQLLDELGVESTNELLESDDKIDEIIHQYGNRFSELFEPSNPPVLAEMGTESADKQPGVINLITRSLENILGGSSMKVLAKMGTESADGSSESANGSSESANGSSESDDKQLGFINFITRSLDNILGGGSIKALAEMGTESADESSESADKQPGFINFITRSLDNILGGGSIKVLADMGTESADMQPETVQTPGLMDRVLRLFSDQFSAHKVFCKGGGQNVPIIINNTRTVKVPIPNFSSYKNSSKIIYIPVLDFDKNGKPIFGSDMHGKPFFDYEKYGKPLFDYQKYGKQVFDYEKYGKPVFDYQKYGKPIFDYERYGKPVFDYEKHSKSFFDFFKHGKTYFHSDNINSRNGAEDN